MASKQRLDTIYGELTVDLAEHDLIRRCLSAYGEWGLLECSFAAGLVRPGFSAVDVGAFVGTFSLGLSMFGAKSVVSVEPNKLASESLKLNLRRNCKTSYAVVEAPLGLNDGQLWSLEVVQENMGATHLVPVESDALTALEIMELREVREKHGPYDLLKIDAEGHEQFVILGDKDYISQSCQAVFIETNNDSDQKEIVDFLSKSGFVLYCFSFPAFNRNNYKQSSDNFLGVAYEANLVAVRARDLVLSDYLKASGCALKEIETFEDLKEARRRVCRWGPVEWSELNRAELLGILSRTRIDLNRSEARMSEHRIEPPVKKNAAP